MHHSNPESNDDQLTDVLPEPLPAIPQCLTNRKRVQFLHSPLDKLQTFRRDPMSPGATHQFVFEMGRLKTDAIVAPRLAFKTILESTQVGLPSDSNSVRHSLLCVYPTV